MIIVINKWKQKVLSLLTVLMLIIAFALAIPVLSGLFYERVPVFSGWFQEEHPTGNPMRVENSTGNTRFNQMVDQFVIKVQDFYYEEKN